MALGLLDLVVDNIDVLCTMDPSTGDSLGVMRQAAVGFQDGGIAWRGDAGSCPEARERIDGRGCVALPGLVDCHTHSLFAGSRAGEFSRRLSGVSYSEILEEGGGILSTVEATRAASDESLVETLEARLQHFLSQGVTTVEVKTGYGLSTAQELRLLQLLRSREWPVKVFSTFLGAHAVPAEHRGSRERYVDTVVEEMVPQAAGLADFVDVYCDRGAFDLAETERILAAGMAAGMGGRIHAEQVTHTGAAALAARMGCSSADHLERIDAEGIRAMAEEGTTAVLLPGALLYLGDESPPVVALREAGIPLAVATDFNPGSSPIRNLLSSATLACLTMGLTVEEALLGITRRAGGALNRKELGWLGKGSAADLALFEMPPGEAVEAEVLVQYLGDHRTRAVIREGRRVWG